MPADSDKERLPFEPKGKRKKAQPEKSQSVADTPTQAATAKSSNQFSQRSPSPSDETSIPEVISRRMLRRMLYFSGIPVILGIFVFFVSYVLIVQGIAALPNVVVLLTTLACFGLSVVGLSYGALSASWEEDALGSLIGFEQFQVNVRRLLASWRQARDERRNTSS